MADKQKRKAPAKARAPRPGVSGDARGKRAAAARGRNDAKRPAGERLPVGEKRTTRGKRLANEGRSARDARPDRARRLGSDATYIEGRRAVAEALRTGFPVKRALVADGASRDRALAELVSSVEASGIPVRYVPAAELDALSAHGAHQGIALEVGDFPYADLADIIARAGDGPALVLVLDHVTDAGNFGAIVRSAEVVGAAGVVIASKRAAEVTVATYKTSAGAVMHLPIAKVPNIARALDDLKSAGFWVGGASEHAEQVCWESPFEGRIALVMGSEGEGISRLVQEKCDFLTKLPQLGATESLNVAQAATALSFEWLRRNFPAVGDRMTAPAEALGDLLSEGAAGRESESEA